ncbi:MAG: RDD family protein [Gammaproteobacteria bacterium]|nr:RDD family protein [Gammaproteobacteria bacterium]
MRIDEGVRYAGFARRLACGVLDAALLLFVAAVVAIVYLVLRGDAGAEVEGAVAGEADARVAARAASTILLGAWMAMQWLCWWRLGGTPGMLALDCVVLAAASGARLGAAMSAVRVLALWLGMLPLCAAMLWVLFDSRRRGLHDLAALSVVVREDESLLTLDELSEQLR